MNHCHIVWHAEEQVTHWIALHCFCFEVVEYPYLVLVDYFASHEEGELLLVGVEAFGGQEIDVVDPFVESCINANDTTLTIVGTS